MATIYIRVNVFWHRTGQIVGRKDRHFVLETLVYDDYRGPWEEYTEEGGIDKDMISSCLKRAIMCNLATARFPMNISEPVVKLYRKLFSYCDSRSIEIEFCNEEFIHNNL